MIKYLFFFVFLNLIWLNCYSQDTLQSIRLPAKIENGDTIIMANLDGISIDSLPKTEFKNKREERKYTRMVYNLKKVYPYAKIAKKKLEEMNEHYLVLKTEKERKEYAKLVEKDILAQFEGDIRNMTRTQGVLLLKLIDRETGKMPYDLVKEFRGGFSAFFWQAVARVFGQNLKSQYDPNGEDKPIEEILQAIDAGYF